MASYASASFEMRVAARVVSFAAGFLVWAGFSLAGGIHEAWDSAGWWVIGLPLLGLVAGLCGYLAPERVWRWPLFIVAGQLLGMLIVHPPGTGLGLLPLALVLIGVPLLLVLTILAIIGGLIAHRGWDSSVLA
jgi:hypothetical protein